MPPAGTCCPCPLLFIPAGRSFSWPTRVVQGRRTHLLSSQVDQGPPRTGRTAAVVWHFCLSMQPHLERLKGRKARLGWQLSAFTPRACHGLPVWVWATAASVSTSLSPCSERGMLLWGYTWEHLNSTLIGSEKLSCSWTHLLTSLMWLLHPPNNPRTGITRAQCSASPCHGGIGSLKGCSCVQSCHFPTCLRSALPACLCSRPIFLLLLVPHQFLSRSWPVLVQSVVSPASQSQALTWFRSQDAAHSPCEAFNTADKRSIYTMRGSSVQRSPSQCQPCQLWDWE